MTIKYIMVVKFTFHVSDNFIYIILSITPYLNLIMMLIININTF